MGNYLFSVYMKYSGSQRFPAKVFEARTIIQAESREDAINRGLIRLSESLAEYFTDPETMHSQIDEILDNFSLTGGLEENDRLIDRQNVEIYDSGRLRDSSTVIKLDPSHTWVKDKILKKWSPID